MKRIEKRLLYGKHTLPANPYAFPPGVLPRNAFPVNPYVQYRIRRRTQSGIVLRRIVEQQIVAHPGAAQ